MMLWSLYPCFVCPVADVADLMQQRLEAIAADVTAERSAAEPGPCVNIYTLPAMPAIGDVQPAAPSQGDAPAALPPLNDAAQLLQPPSTAAAEHISGGQPQHCSAASPSASEPLTELQSSQPAATESADECMEEVSSPVKPQVACVKFSPAPNGPVIDMPGLAAVAADSTADPCSPGQTPPRPIAEEHQPAGVKAEPPDSIAGPGTGSGPPADATEAAADPSANPSAASVDMPSSIEPAEGASQGPGLQAIDGAHLPVQLAVSHQEDTVNITSASSPRCVSPATVLNHAPAEGPVSTDSPILNRSAAAAFAAVSQHIHSYDDACEVAGAQPTRECMHLCSTQESTALLASRVLESSNGVLSAHQCCVDSIFMCMLVCTLTFLLRDASRQGRVVRRRGGLLHEPAGLAGHELDGRVGVRGRGGAAGRRVGGGRGAGGQHQAAGDDSACVLIKTLFYCWSCRRGTSPGPSVCSCFPDIYSLTQSRSLQHRPTPKPVSG